jgi:Tol biopolymer transport system component
VRYAAPPERGESLWLGAPDGSRAREVIGPAAFDKYFGLRFSPDGRRLVFAAVGQPASLGLIERALGIRPAYANGDLWDLWSVDIDGRNLRPLTAISEDLPVAAWSPDGRRIAFLGGGSASSAEAGLALLVPGNKELRRLTTQPGHRGVDWARN